MGEATFAELYYDQKKRTTRLERFLERLDRLVPWTRLEERIAPHYPTGGGRGRQPYPLSLMLRVHVVQLIENLSDPGMEDALYENLSVQRFVGLRLSEAIPDETTILNFRHRLEAAALGAGLLEEINRHLEAEGLQLRPQSGTIVDASIISAPSSTRNRAKARDPEMHQTRKGNQWYFEMKLHIGVDSGTGIVHSVRTTAANVSDITQVPYILHGNETSVCGDAGYQGVGKRTEHQSRDVTWQVAMGPGKRRLLDPEGESWQKEKHKASVRAKVEHPFQIVKVRFGYAKVRYRGLFKNTQRLALLLGLANIVRAERQLAI